MIEQRPTRADLLKKLAELCAGDVSRSAVAAWAESYLVDDRFTVSDRAGWHALEQLGGADLHGIDHEFLYERVDFQAWLEELQSSPSGAARICKATMV